MKLSFFFLFVSLLISAQKKVEFGQLSDFERTFLHYEKDTTANAVFLYEQGVTYFDIRSNRVWLIKKYHAKKKILNEKGYKHANIEIPYYHNKNNEESILKIKAITHNDFVKNNLKKEDIYIADISENWSEKRFTFPNIKPGSIIEYSYEIQSPFFFNLTGWEFQSVIPKVYSEYTAKIPGNWIYNRSLIGELSLDVNEALIKKGCFSIPGAAKEADCEVLKYAMKDISAFKEDESFMLSGSNYRSRLEFQLSEYRRFDGTKDEYTKSWDDVDKEFKTDKDIGRQLRKKNFFEGKIPYDLLTEGDLLIRAKKIYEFVKDHFIWNQKYGIWYNNNVKKAFEEKTGNVAEINIALINLLNEAGIKANIMLIATRQRGLPKRVHPVISDFNYIIAKLEIEGKSFLLDATDKDVPFGMLPFRCLNYYGRVMDFDEKSYWYDIIPEKNNEKVIRADMTLDTGNGSIKGMFYVSSTGYEYLSQKEKLNSKTEEEYLEEFENSSEYDFHITSYEPKKEYSGKEKLTEKFEFEVENFNHDTNIYLNPFLIKFFDKNPFVSSERHYPIDFGYLRTYRYFINFNVPKGYRLKSLPQHKNLILPENAGSLKYYCQKDFNDRVTVFFELKLNATQYRSEAYSIIKEFFSEVVHAQNQTTIVYEKV